ncbi:MAG: undecaprenyl-diphosphate phosphatase [Myxococcota bacterium]|nr:undecaprenyl-diphosphate phosphatase [Myxococcota bacterium]
MADWLQAILLGALQGLTEFLPVSSSGHLVLAQEWLGEDFFASDNPLFFDLVLHVGTLLPVFWFYRRELVGILKSPREAPSLAEAGGLVAWLRGNPSRWMGVMVLVGSVPTALIGLTFEDSFESLFSSVGAVCTALVITALLLIGTAFVKERQSGGPISLLAALGIGAVQGLAITPGISRSGSTIAFALFGGFDREQAARFSFLLSIPAILGAVVLKTDASTFGGEVDWLALGCGFVSSALVGYLALTLLVAVVRKGALHRFAGYLIPVALVGWLFLA